MMVLPFLVVYLTRERRFTPGEAGVALGLYGAAAIVAGPVSGRLSDRIGALPIMRIALLLSGSMLLIFPLAHSHAAVYGMTILWAACAELFRPASLAAITHAVTPEQRKPAYALNRLAINLGMSIGPALGGFLATVSFRAMFVVDAFTTILAGVLLTLLPWRLASRGRVSILDVRADQQLERGSALGSVLTRQFPQIPIGQFGGRLEISTIERDHRAAKRRKRMTDRSIE